MGWWDAWDRRRWVGWEGVDGGMWEGGDMFVGTTGKGRRRDERVGGLGVYVCV